MRVRTRYYQQFDADPALAAPGEGYGGWRAAELELAPEHTALVVMHAWDCGTPDEYPGWHRAVEYIPRAYAICRDVLPPLLAAWRGAGLELFHVVASSPSAYYRAHPGYLRARALAGPEPPAPARARPDPAYDALWRFRSEHVFPGQHNREDIARGQAAMGFCAGAEPLGSEGIAENGHQLHALCREAGVNHLIYTGFAINWCLLMSPGGMADMQPRGYLCSAVRDAVTAVENKESARAQGHRAEGLWRVALAFGYVYDSADLVRALQA